MLRRVSRVWSRAFRVLYAILGFFDPLIRAAHRRFGIGNVVELRMIGRSSGLPRTTLVGLLRADDRLYLGHPNGDCGWTRNLEAAGQGELVLRSLPALEFRPVRLSPGPERDAAIRATSQHPFPGNLIYRLARSHVLAVGTYFRLEPAT